MAQKRSMFRGSRGSWSPINTTAVHGQFRRVQRRQSEQRGGSPFCRIAARAANITGNY